MPKRAKMPERPLPTHLRFEDVLATYPASFGEAMQVFSPPEYRRAVEIHFDNHPLVRDYLAWAFECFTFRWQEDGSCLVFVPEQLRIPSIIWAQERLKEAKERFEQEFAAEP